MEKNHSHKLPLDHIIKERYPTFIDALRDLDDALSLIFLFASLPSTSDVPPKTIALCQRLCLEFEHYLIVTHSLRKTFLSIKGIYYQATIQGQDIMWLVPYQFVQRVTGDVDYRIMATFVEFYATLLGFVNFRLYTTIGLVYPPKFDAQSDEQGGGLTSFLLEGKGVDGLKAIESTTNGETNGEVNVKHPLPEEIQKQIEHIHEPDTSAPENQLIPPPTSVSQTQDQPDAIDTFNPLSTDADTLPQPAPSTSAYSTLFAPFTFFISRETPKAPLEFLLRAFGCKRIGWSSVLGAGAYTTDELNPAITHQIVDRPPLNIEAYHAPLPPTQTHDTSFPPTESHTDTAHRLSGEVTAEEKAQPAGFASGLRMPNRVYVQPQWVWDSINTLALQPPHLYAPGAMLPPHLSPWVKPRKGVYDPTIPLAEQEKEGEAVGGRDIEDGQDGRALQAPGFGNDDDISSPILKANGKDDAPFDPEKDRQLDDLEDEVGASAIGAAFDALIDSPSDAEPPSASGNISDADSFAGFASQPSSDNEDTLHQKELEAEARGGGPQSTQTPSTNSAADKARRERERQKKDEADELERRKGMLGRKKRKLVEKMLYSNASTEREAERLRGKRRRIENAKERARGGG